MTERVRGGQASVAAAGGLSAVVVGMAIFGGLFAGPAPEAGRPLEVLYITGGCCHDYDGQKRVIVEGLASRARINVTVVHEGGTSTDHRISIYETPGWSKGYDVVFHNECFANVTDPDFVRSIVREHEEGGVPAVMMHCAMHCYRAGIDDWFRLCGITSPAHGKHYPFAVQVLGDHPIVRGLPPTWELPKEELYYCDRVWPAAEPLAEAMSRERESMQTVVWTNEAGKARVFGTTLGHYTDTVALPEFLDLITRGTLWAAGKLEDDGSPTPDVRLTPGADAPVTADSPVAVGAE
jgi:type 1 glutamine amidotransferase